MGSETRRRTKRIFIRCSPDEYETILQNAESCRVTVPELLRQLGQAHTPKSTLDAQHIRELARLREDIGKQGELLKRWLTDKEGFAKRLDVPETLAKIRTLQKKLAEKIRQL